MWSRAGRPSWRSAQRADRPREIQNFVQLSCAVLHATGEIMSLITAGALTRRPLGPRPPQFPHETTAQQVPDSPLSPFFATHPSGPTARPGQRGVLCSPSSGSPLAQVPEGGSPLLRQVLDCKFTSAVHAPWSRNLRLTILRVSSSLAGRKRQREDSTLSPSPTSKRSSRDSPRVPNSIIIVRRTAPPSSKGAYNISTHAHNTAGSFVFFHTWSI